MEAKAQLLYKSYLTHFHTFLPVYFYGTVEGKIYCVYTRFYQRLYSETNIEVVFLQHKEYTYDYDLGLIFDNDKNVISHESFRSIVDQPGQPYIMMKLFGKFKSYAEVLTFLNKKAVEKIHNLELKHA